MNIRIDSNFNFLVTSIQYFPNGELFISLTSEENQSENRYQYEAALGSGQAEEKPTISLLQYAKSFASSADIKPKTKDTYRLMCNHLEAYGDSHDAYFAKHILYAILSFAKNILFIFCI